MNKTADCADPLTRNDFPTLPAGSTGWVLHGAACTIRVADRPDTDWPGTLEFLAKLRNQWEFCTHEPSC